MKPAGAGETEPERLISGGPVVAQAGRSRRSRQVSRKP
jgi:hypothetical protein